MNQALLTKLQGWYEQHEKVLVAFSGGADSCLAAYLGRKFLGRAHVLAVISTSPSLKKSDLAVARKFATEYDIELLEIETNEMQNSNYLANPTNRCYFCKNALYNYLESLLTSKYKGYTLLNGNNYDDLGDYRPGMDAAKEHKIQSPFIDCQVRKNDIRSLSKDLGLFTWNKTASPCLSSRFPYGENISESKLKQVEAAENLILGKGFSDVRVRHYGTTAKVEVPHNEVKSLLLIDTLGEKFKELGFAQVQIDQEGLVSGKMNRVLTVEKRENGK